MFINSNNILSNGFIINVKIDNGNIIIDISGTNIKFINGVYKFISWKLFIEIGILDRNDIILVISIFKK